MPQLRHIVIATQDPEKALEFYTKGFGFRTLKYIDVERASGYFLTDGVLNIALLKFHSDQLGKGMDYVGLHHFGVYTDDPDAWVDAVQSLGAVPYTDEMESVPPANSKRPDKFRGFEGMVFDISGEPWPGNVDYRKPPSTDKA